MIQVLLGDIFTTKADYFISSGNVLLNMSGGVNGGLLELYGVALQRELHDEIKRLSIKSVNPGYCYKFQAKIGSYESVVYSVGIDGWYESSQSLVIKTIHGALDIMSPLSGGIVVVPAIGTGYGKLSKAEFGIALKDIIVPNGVTLVVVEKNEIGYNQIVKSYEGK